MPDDPPRRTDLSDRRREEAPGGTVYTPAMPTDRWEDANAYERFMGRWSRQLAFEFLEWLDPAPGEDWLEVGCGTGALTGAILDRAEPHVLVACDTAKDFVDYCAEALPSQRLEVVLVAPGELPGRIRGFDLVVSSLVLNFLPDAVGALRRMGAACGGSGRVAACVWDYAEGMEFLRHFWDAALAVSEDAASFDEGRRFPLCTPDALGAAFAAADLQGVTVGSITILTRFAGFDDYWNSFVDGPGPAPTYLSSLSEPLRRALASELRARLPVGSDGSISLRARAWTAQGRSRGRTAQSRVTAEATETRARKGTSCRA